MRREHDSDLHEVPRTSGSGSDDSRRSFLLRAAAVSATAILPPSALGQSVFVNGTRFKRIPVQFIAALGERRATSGNNAEAWGLWRRDPGPRGVRLSQFDRLLAAGGKAPANWQFDDTDWWLEEHGLIMESPEFPVAPGQYLVTGDREVTSILTVDPVADGHQLWALADGATLYDVTHLRCRSARYTPAAGNASCSPANAKQSEFPVAPGGTMPPVEGCDKQDYAVLFVIGVPE